MKLALSVCFAALAVASSACVPPQQSRVTGGLVASEEPRIWVVRDRVYEKKVVSEVYRCADGASANAPPKPVCVRAPMVDNP